LDSIILASRIFPKVPWVLEEIRKGVSQVFQFPTKGKFFFPKPRDTFSTFLTHLIFWEVRAFRAWDFPKLEPLILSLKPFWARPFKPFFYFPGIWAPF